MGKRAPRARAPRPAGGAGGPWRAPRPCLAGPAAEGAPLAQRGNAASAPDLETGGSHDSGWIPENPFARNRSRSCSPPAPASHGHGGHGLLRALASAPALRRVGAAAAAGAAALGASPCPGGGGLASRRRHVSHALLLVALVGLALLALQRRAGSHVGATQGLLHAGAAPRRSGGGGSGGGGGGGGAALKGSGFVADPGISDWAAGASDKPWDPDSGERAALLPHYMRELVRDDAYDGRRTWAGAARARAARAAEALRCWVASDPVARLLPGGPARWYYAWAAHGGPWPGRLWDPGALVDGAPWPVGSAQGFCAALGNGSVALVGNGPLAAGQRGEIAAAAAVVRFNAVNNWCGRARVPWPIDADLPYLTQQRYRHARLPPARSQQRRQLTPRRGARRLTPMVMSLQCRLPGERTDVWMVRYHGQRPSLFWGLRQLPRREAAAIAAGARAVLFLGGHLRGRYAGAVAEARERYPYVPAAKAVQARRLRSLSPDRLRPLSCGACPVTALPYIKPSQRII